MTTTCNFAFSFLIPRSGRAKARHCLKALFVLFLAEKTKSVFFKHLYNCVDSGILQDSTE